MTVLQIKRTEKDIAVKDIDCINEMTAEDIIDYGEFVFDRYYEKGIILNFK